MTSRPGITRVRGCSHVASVTFARLRAACRRCGAEWKRDPEGPWRLVVEGSEPKQSSMIPLDDPDGGMRAD